MDNSAANGITAKASEALAHDKDVLATALSHLRTHIANYGDYILPPGNGDHCLAAKRYRKQIASQVIDPNVRSNDTVRDAKIEEACQLNPAYHEIMRQQAVQTAYHQELLDTVEVARSALKNEQIVYGLLAAALAS